jgi:hypothetical protein
MKTKIIIAFSLMIFSLAVEGQNKLDKIRAPSSPAASVIGIQPTTILTPKSYQALEANLFSNYLDESGSPFIPNDVGLEFTPYWFTNPKMGAAEYLFPSPWESLLRNLSVSVASTQDFMLGDSAASNALGIGLRTSMHIPNKKDKDSTLKHLKTLMDVGRIKNIITNYAVGLLYQYPDSIQSKAEFIKVLTGFLIEENSKLKLFATQSLCNTTLADFSLVLTEQLPEYSPDMIDMFIEVFSGVADVYFDRTKVNEEIKYFRDFKPGLNIDLAGAMALSFPTNNFDYSMLPKSGFWLTLSYNFNGGWAFLKILGVLNYNWYDRNFYEKYFAGYNFFDNNLDYGLGLNFNYKRFSAELEAVGRQSKTIIDQNTNPGGVTTTTTQTENDFQYIANISYSISDSFILTYSIGNRFKPVFSYSGTLVSTLSLNFGFGGPDVKNIK